MENLRAQIKQKGERERDVYDAKAKALTIVEEIYIHVYTQRGKMQIYKR